MDENSIIPYIDPIFRFCCKRLSNRCDAEDLASEIVCHILDGMKKYKIESLDAWVWRIVHNRYARFIDAQKRDQTILSDDDALFDIADDDYSHVDEEAAEREFESVFRCLHTLSSEYRNIFIDYYIGELSIRRLSEKYSLPETTIKWRLNAGREKIRKRIGENRMDKVYKRINWCTTACNGSMDSDKYLHTQIARAICEAAYEKPLTVEEISLKIGIPAMYIEDELPRLEYGDAVSRIGNKYATSFIVFRLKDRKQTEGAAENVVNAIADLIENALTESESEVRKLSFYGHDFGMDRLGYFLIPYLLRKKIWYIRENRMNLASGAYPPRKDGGYGWFIVEETVDEDEQMEEYATGCNIAGDDSGSRSAIPSRIYYYWIAKYFCNDIYHNGGTRWMCANGIPQNSRNGIVAKGSLTDEDAARLIRNNLIVKSGDDYKLNFACFTEEEFAEFTAMFSISDEKIDGLLAEWILSVRKSFESFVPKRLDDQINQWITGYLFRLIGYVIDELIRRGTLRKPEPEKPLTDGVVCVEGKYIEL